MANSFSASFPEIWAREQQEIFYKENVGMKVADMSFRWQMSRGDTLNRPYRSTDSEVQTYTRWTAITIDDKTDTNEQLVINKEFATWFYIDDFDKIQNNYNAAANYWKDDWVYLSNQVDADILWEYGNATSTVDDGTVWGTAWNWIALATTNVLSVVSSAKKKLAKQNIPLNSLFWVISPEFEQILIEYWAWRDTPMWDTANKEWRIMNFYDFDLYRSNQVAWSAVLALATQPTANDTVTIAWQTFTFVSSIWTTAWNVLIWANVDATRASLATLINAPATTTATWVALTWQSLRRFKNKISATNDDTANTLTVVYKGAWVLDVAEALTDGTDTWTATKEKQHNLFGKRGWVSVVMQRDALPQIKQVPDKLWVNILNWVLYWVKTFGDWAKKLVNVEIKASTF